MKKITLLLCLLITTNALAWDVVGHRIIADIAYRNLTPQARAAVDKTLGFERAMVAMSSWADEIKSDTIYSGQDKWHYQDIDPGKSDKDLAKLYNDKTLEGYFLFAAKDRFIKLLTKEPNNADALKFIIHLTADQYQPMHMGHKDDLGGNRARFYWFGRSTNLHSLWDTSMIQYTHYSSTEYCEYLCNKFGAQRDELYNLDELTCIKRTYAAATAIYKEYNRLCKGAKTDEKGAYRWAYGSEYRFTYKFMPTLDRQLYLAGIQLARTLNEIYK